MTDQIINLDDGDTSRIKRYGGKPPKKLVFTNKYGNRMTIPIPEKYRDPPPQTLSGKHNAKGKLLKFGENPGTEAKPSQSAKDDRPVGDGPKTQIAPVRLGRENWTRVGWTVDEWKAYHSENLKKPEIAQWVLPKKRWLIYDPVYCTLTGSAVKVYDIALELIQFEQWNPPSKNKARRRLGQTSRKVLSDVVFLPTNKLEALGIPAKTRGRALQELCQKGFLEKQPRNRKGEAFTYRVLRY